MVDFIRLLKRAINLAESAEEDDTKNKVGEMTMPELLQAIYKQMRQTESNVTLAMAQVGLKRKELGDLLKKRDGLEQEAEAHELAGRTGYAKAVLSEMFNLDKRIDECSEQVMTLDTNAQQEIINFRDLEAKYSQLKDQVTEAKRLKPFVDMISRTNVAVDEFGEAVCQEVESRLNAGKLTVAQQAARVALRAGNIQQQAIRQEGQRILEAEHLDKVYLEFQQRVKEKNTGGLEGKEQTKALESSSVKARQLLANPAFGNLIINKK